MFAGVSRPFFDVAYCRDQSLFEGDLSARTLLSDCACGAKLAFIDGVIASELLSRVTVALLQRARYLLSK